MVAPQLNTLVPNSQSPIGEVRANGKVIGQAFVTQVWASFFQQFTQQAPAVEELVLDGSPFLITPNTKGTMIVTGGTISDISLIRGLVVINLTGERIIPIGIGDTFSITYSVEPVVQFLA